MTHTRIILIGASLTTCFNAARALEAKDLLSYRFGKTTFQPRVAVSSAYSDNITYNDRASLTDVITSIAPGVGMTLGTPGDDTVFTAGYQLEQLFYADNDPFNAQNHSIQISGHLDRNRFDYDGSASFQRLSTLLGGSISDPLLLGTSLKVGRFVYGTTHVLDYTLSDKTGVYAGPTYNAVDYDRGTPLFDLNTVAGVAGFRYGLTPKTHLFGEMSYGQSEVDPNRPGDPKGPSSAFLSGSIGSKFDFSSKISGVVRVGYETRSFSNDASAPSEPVVSAAISYKLSHKIATSLNYSRRSATSIQFSSQTAVVDSIGLTLTQQIGNTGKFGANAGLAYQTSSYVSNTAASRTDEHISANIGFFYNFQLWLKSGLTYSNIQTSSSLPAALAYTENRVALVISVGY